jgi:hypothetical protein
LPELAIDGVSDQLCKPSLMGVMMEMIESKALLNHIADF